MGKKSRRNRKGNKSGSPKELTAKAILFSAVADVVGSDGNKSGSPKELTAKAILFSVVAEVVGSHVLVPRSVSDLLITNINDAMVVIDDDGWENLATWMCLDSKGTIDRMGIRTYLPKSCKALHEGKVDPTTFATMIHCIYDVYFKMSNKQTHTKDEKKRANIKLSEFWALQFAVQVAIQNDIKNSTVAAWNQSGNITITSQTLKKHMPISCKALMRGDIERHAFIGSACHYFNCPSEILETAVKDIMRRYDDICVLSVVGGVRAYDMIANLSVSKVAASIDAIEDDGWENFITWAKSIEERTNKEHLATHLPNTYNCVREGMVDTTALGRLIFYCCDYIDEHPKLTGHMVYFHASTFPALVAVAEDGGERSLGWICKGHIDAENLEKHLPNSCKALREGIVKADAFPAAIFSHEVNSQRSVHDKELVQELEMAVFNMLYPHHHGKESQI